MSIATNILIDYLYKKALGAPQTNPNTDIEGELEFSSVPNIFQSQNYAQNFNSFAKLYNTSQNFTNLYTTLQNLTKLYNIVIQTLHNFYKKNSAQLYITL